MNKSGKAKTMVTTAKQCGGKKGGNKHGKRKERRRTKKKRTLIWVN